MVVWVTGFPGAGKTSFSLALSKYLNAHGTSPVLLDGDNLRDCLKDLIIVGHSKTERLKLASTYARFANLLSKQGHIVLVATVSMNELVRSWNKEHNVDYIEILINPEFKELKKRDQKSLYSSNGIRNEEDLVKIGIEPFLPEDPNFTFTVFDNSDVELVGQQIMARHT